MSSTSFVASVSRRLSRLGDAIAEHFDHAQHAIILLNSLLRSERERLPNKRDVNLGAHIQNLSHESDGGPRTALSEGGGRCRASTLVAIPGTRDARSSCEGVMYG